ncbi:MAG: carboxymuconolactone decarboxylase family protein [Desulfovibrio sp.]
MTYTKHQPEIGTASNELAAEVYKDGLLRGRDKRLMALCGALISGCRACILFQTHQALELGVSAEEILEACGVAISLGGTMAAGETCRVVALLRERGRL